MKKLLLPFALLWCFSLFAASPSFQQASNMPNIFVSNQIVVGNPLTGTKITSANGVGFANNLPWVEWNAYVDYNTNSVDVTNGAALFNQAYTWFATGNAYTNSVQITRNLTNRIDFAATNVLGVGVTQYWAEASSLGGSSVNVTTNLNRGQWFSATTGAASNVVSFFRTNALYTAQTFGSATNWNGVTNGESMLLTSNGVPYNITSQVGSTNQTWTLLLPVYFPSGQNITNMYTTNVTLDFPSTSANVSVLPVTITGTELGDTVIVNSAGDNNLLVNGSFTAAASNNTVFVKFSAIGAGVDPASQLFRVTVLKAR